MTSRRTPLTDDRLTVALEAAREAGEIQREQIQSPVVEEHHSPGDLVTHTDLRTERRILSHIELHYPDHSVIAEESGSRDGSSEQRWIVDPLDGTVNFYHGIPEFAVSIAVEQNGIVEVGVVYHVMRDTVFTAVRGEGAYRENVRLGVSGERVLERALVGTGFSSARAGTFEALSAIVRDAHGVRRIGSAALDMAYVASGLFEGFYQQGLNAWDIAAGQLLVEEAGGRVSDYSDASLGGTPGTGAVLATNGYLHQELLDRLD